ncbi:putative reverse transcriptase domain-containing protein [Tanacetum coccineum]|uniref:Reverse transcriptase domain-containing protein n=1 Tax=Tanacetum coccineum TaxID=301880 RepID=A0ABQ5AWZ2_9ASTR
MAPKRATRSNIAPEITNTTSVTNAQLQAMINQGVTAALAARDANTNGVDSHNSGTGARRNERATRECTYPDFMKCQPLNFKGTEGVVELTQWIEKMETVFRISNYSVENQIKFSTCTLLGNALSGESTLGLLELALLYGRMFPEESDKIKKYVGGLPDMIHGSVVASKPKTIQTSKGVLEDTQGTLEPQQQQYNEVFRNRNIAGLMLQELLRRNHMGDPNPYAQNAIITTMRGTGSGPERSPLFRRQNPDSNVVTGTFLLKNHYASVLFDTGADRSFVSTAFSSQIVITLTALDHYYDVELADGRIIGLNTNLKGCTLNILNHPFNIDLRPVELGSFDAIIGMDWLVKYQAIIVCAEKIIRIPWRNETLIVHGDETNQGHEARLHIISYTKTQEYMLKGCPIFLAHVTTNGTEDKSKEKLLEDVPIVRDFPDVFLEDLLGLPLTRQVELQIDLIPGAAPRA